MPLYRILDDQRELQPFRPAALAARQMDLAGGQ